MASHQRQPQVEEQSPQPSTSGYSLPEVVDNEMPGPSVPWVDPSPPLRFLCSKRKREWLDESEKLDEEPEKAHTPESEETWVVETLCDLKVKLKKRRVSPMLPEHHKVFNSLLAPWVDRNPPLRFLCWKRKREWLDESEEEPEKVLAPEPEDTWVVETLCGLKVKLKRWQVSSMLPEHHEVFNRLLDLHTQDLLQPLLRAASEREHLPCPVKVIFSCAIDLT
ncbi:speedy protein E16-like isoform X1 [Aotus nancymaae]|uniref:speedy protein E16-like isoform X1 n=1 Tax=Aotus nancymaae TaxID=37293 RepID=UPI0030FF073D